MPKKSKEFIKPSDIEFSSMQVQTKKMKEKKILICDDVAPLLLTGLKNKYIIDYRPEIKQEEVENCISEYAGIVINSKTTLHRKQLEMASKLEWLARLGSGMEIIDVEFAKERKIEVINTPGSNANAVSEHALGMLLALSSKICQADRSIRAGSWEREKHRGFELEGKTIGIIGFGNTGSLFAQRLSGFDVEILVFDKYKKRFGDSYRYVNAVEQIELLNRSDVISFHVPLNNETRHYFNSELLKHCKKNIIVINTSRGSVIDTDFLLASIRSGKVYGACLDVFETESKEALNTANMKYLRQHERVVLTPHVAGWTVESKKKISERIMLELTKRGFL